MIAAVTVLLLDAPSLPVAEQVAAAWRRTGICPALDGGDASPLLDGRLQTLPGRDLPAAFADAPAGGIVAAANQAGGARVGQVVRRVPARLDRPTRGRIEALLFEDWLAARRQDATIRWHWV